MRNLSFRAFRCVSVLLLTGFCALTDAAHSEVPRFSPFDDARAASGLLNYVNPSAPRGGTLRLGSTLNYDTTNLLRFPGRAPNELNYIFDTLLVRAEDELATYFGLLASEVQVAEDFSVARFRIDPRARWHNGDQVSAEDVAFTFRTLARYGLPIYRAILEPIEITVIDDLTIEFRSNDRGSWTHIDLIGTFPIQSKSFWSDRDVSDASFDVPLGSGPYRMVIFTSDNLDLERFGSYWARDHPLTCGRWNFDRIRMVRFFDKTSLTEALKRGDLDLLFENDPKAWLSAYDGPALQSGALVQSAFERHGTGQLNSLVLNARRKPLDDIRVREAIALAFDAAWINDLQGNVYQLPDSIYGKPEFAAEGIAGPLERQLLAPFETQLPDDVLSRPGPDPSRSVRERLRRASALLDAAGYSVQGKWRRGEESGEPLTLTYVTAHPSTLTVVEPFRTWLERLGIQLDIQVSDLVTGRRLILNHKYDLTWLTWSPGLPPGRLEQLYWHSMQSGDHGYGLAGANDPAMDAMIETMQNSLDIDEIAAASRAFDRIVRWGHYLIPVSWNNEIWFVHDEDLAYPKSARANPSPVEQWWWAGPPREDVDRLEDRDRWPASSCSR